MTNGDEDALGLPGTAEVNGYTDEKAMDRLIRPGPGETFVTNIRLESLGRNKTSILLGDALNG